MDAIRRKPSVEVIIKRPNWKNESSLEEFTIVTFEPNPCTDEEKSRAKSRWVDPQDYNAKSDALLSYTYTEARQSFDSAFTLSLTAEQDNNRLTWVDKIASLDLVFIKEFGKVRYCGIVHGVRYSTRMGERGPERNVMVEGNGFGQLLQLFHLVLDVTIFEGVSADVENLKANSEFISKGDTSFEAAIMFYYNNFMNIITKRGKQQSIMGLLIEKYMTLEVDKNCNTLLPICQSMYQLGVNTLYDMIRKIIPEPMYELFGRWDTDKGKYIITARQSPFRPADWKTLQKYRINPVTLKSCDVGYSDSDIFTAYYGLAPSFGYTKNMALVVDNLQRNHKIDEERWKKYGYRPLSVELSFLKRDEIQPNNVESSLVEIGKLLESWYKDNDRFLSGVISVISYEDASIKYPVVGGRLEILEGEFYIDEVQRKWTYGNSPTSEIKVIRGGAYSQNGDYEGTIAELGRRLQEFIDSKKGKPNTMLFTLNR
jgi:hypothetical protein